MKLHKLSVLIVFLTLGLFACREKTPSPEKLKEDIFETKQKLSTLEAEYERLLQEGIVKQEDGMRVRILTAKKEYVEHQFRATGVADADRMAFVSPETNGQIKKIHVREGQYVQAGQLLISLNASVLQNNLREVEKALELAELMYERQSILKEQGVGKEIDYLQAKNQKESLQIKIQTLKSQIAMSQVRAPFSGLADRIEAKEGELASPGMPLILIVDLSKITVKADVAERYVPIIKKGTKVAVGFEAYPEYTVDTEVTRTGNLIHPTNRTFVVEVQLDNKDNKIKPNMVSELKLTDYTGNEILIPSNIIHNDQIGQYVYEAVKENNQYTAQKKYINTGFTIGASIVAKEGISEGDLIITEGNNLVSNGMRVSIID